jgi:hypothetical protein
MNCKKLLLTWILATLISSTAFSYDAEKRFSIQTSPLFLVGDIIYLLIDNDAKTYPFLLDTEFQYAINGYFNFSVTNIFYFENYTYSYQKNSNGRFNEKYGHQLQYLFMPAFLYRPFGTWLKGMYLGTFPIIGWTNVSTEHFNDGFTHIGLGLNGGYQWVFGNGFTIQLGTGINKTWIIPFANNKSIFRTEEERHLLNLPVDILFTFRLGYSF